MPIQTRREMAERLEEVMSHAYTDLEERQRLEAGTSLLKTYLLEAHSGDAGHGDILRILTAAFSPEMLGQRSRATVHETQEEFFYRIAAQWAINTAEFFVDASDRRFWILHSASDSKKADNILHRVIANDTHLDSAWLRALEARLSTINSPAYRARPTATFAEFASRWDATVLSQHKPSTQSSTRSQLRRGLLPELGKCALKDLDGQRLQAFVSGCRCNAKTIRNLVATLRMMWNSARAWG
jgi:hypothetical protein